MKVSKLQASAFMIGLLTAVMIFHFTVIFGLIPYTMVWGGKLQSEQDMYFFEVVSLAVNLLLIMLLLQKRKLLRQHRERRPLNLMLWFFVVLFILNTVGNLLAETDLEKWAFTPLTALSAVLLFRIVRKDTRSYKTEG